MTTATKKTKKKTARAPEQKKLAPPVPAGLLDGNGRTARLARWLRDMPPADVTQLVLEMKTDDGWSRVQSWKRSDVHIGLSLTIDAAVVDLANELGSYLTCKVAWLDSEGDIWTEHGLRAQPEGMSAAQSFGGDANSVAVQTQRALERMVGAFMGGIETSQRLSERSAEIACQNFESAQAELTLLREKVVELERDNADLQHQLDEALTLVEKAQTDAQQNQGKQQFTQLMTSLLAQQMATPNKPPAS